jgi:hypothetical protein
MYLFYLYTYLEEYFEQISIKLKDLNFNNSIKSKLFFFLDFFNFIYVNIPK